MNATQVNADLTALLKARHTLLWITSREEQRVERALIQASADARYPIKIWNCANGLTDSDGRVIDASLADPNAMIAYIRDRRERCVYIMEDLHKWLDPVVLRGIRSLARTLQAAPPGEARAVVVLTPSSEIPPEWAGHATVVEYPLPDRGEISRLLDDVLGALPDDVRGGALPDGTRDAAIDAAVGLTAEEASNCYARSLVSLRRIDPGMVAGEKRRTIAREKVLTWYDADPRGLSAVGGYDVLKRWTADRALAFSPEARAYGLPSPRGVFLVGVPGGGKSLMAKALAGEWRVPLLRLDMGALKSKYVGESETNLRKALQVAETVGRCVLWIDEIEKALAGASGPAGDGGVAADGLGALLSWMQERAGQVFVLATANDVRALPPELLRKGRFDELFFVDLPTAAERGAITRATLAQHGKGATVDLDVVARATEGYTGAEIAALVPDAMFTAFADGSRDVTTDDLTRAAATVTPLSKTAAEKLDGLRTWAKGRCRWASVVEVAPTGPARKLDL